MKLKREIDSFPLIMGILNITPDSFSDGGFYFDKNKAVDHVYSMVDAGADIIDIGGESTRPGSEPASLEVELERTIPVIEEISARIKVPLSIDTYKKGVAEEALNAGASIVNDISGLKFDSELGPLVAERKCPVIISHIKGTPGDMQKNPYYTDVLEELKEFFIERLNYCKDTGIKLENVILDPGIGFGKRLEDNLKLIANINYFSDLGQALLVGTSRKSFLGMLLDEPDPLKREYGSLATFGWLAIQGVDILRVHNVEAAREFLKVLQELKNAEIMPQN